MLGIVIIGFFVMFAVVLASLLAATRFMENSRKNRVANIIQSVSGDQLDAPGKIFKDRPEDKTGLDTALSRFDFAKTFRLWIVQADLAWSLPSFILYSLICGAAGFFFGLRVSRAGLAFPVISGLVVSTLPFLYLRRTRRKRLERLEAQLPDALDFLARSMRAGHALTISLSMAGQELPEPIGREFRTLSHEQNLGSPMETALDGLCRRVPILDLRFFSSALLLQRQTGGNLSEILRQLSAMIRERFRLRGQVRALSAHGRLTSVILTVLPLATAFGLTLIAPEYLAGMAGDPDGRKLIFVAILMMFIGTLAVRKIVKIRV